MGKSVQTPKEGVSSSSHSSLGSGGVGVGMQEGRLLQSSSKQSISPSPSSSSLFVHISGCCCAGQAYHSSHKEAHTSILPTQSISAYSDDQEGYTIAPLERTSKISLS